MFYFEQAKNEHMLPIMYALTSLCDDSLYDISFAACFKVKL